MDIVARLKEFISLSGYQTSQFADVAQIPRPTLSQILNGRNRKVSNELIGKLHAAFPSLNIMWLMFGDGQPELKPDIETSRPQNTQNLFDSDNYNTENETVDSFTNQISFNDLPDQSGKASAINEVHSEDEMKYNVNRATSVKPEVETVLNPLQQIAARREPTLASVATDSSKSIQSIMVFYDDNSFEIFTPSQRS